MPLAKRNSNSGMDQCTEAPSQRRERTVIPSTMRGKSRIRGHRQIEVIIIKVTTIIIASISLTPIKYQALCLHLFLPRPQKVSREISVVQMREPKPKSIPQLSWSLSPGLSDTSLY